MGAGRPGEALDRLALAETIVGKVSTGLSKAYSVLQEEAANAKASKYRADVDEMLAKGEHDAANQLLQTAQSEFPDNRDLQRIRKTLDQAVQRREEARKLLGHAQDLFRENSWRQGADTCLRAGPLSRRDPILHKEILSALEGAAEASLATDWRHAEYLLLCMTQFQPNVALPAKVRERIAQSKGEEAISQCLREAEDLKASGDLGRTLERVDAGLATYPNEARLSAMRQDILELRKAKDEEQRLDRERKAKEDYLAQLHTRVDRERRLDVRAQILEEALQKYPEESTLQKELAKTQSLAEKVAALTQQAQSLESSRNYDKAIQAWLAIGELGIPHPDIDSSLDRLRRQNEEARGAIKAACLAWLSVEWRLDSGRRRHH